MSTFKVKQLNIETNGKKVVKSVGFIIESGEIHILMGPNGSGKSTLLNGIFCHPGNHISAGNILFDGNDITNLHTEEKAKLGLFLSIQQLPKIEGVTLLQCIYAAVKDREENKSMSIFDVHKKMKNIAEEFGISARFLTENINAELSGGEKKQAEILQLVSLSPKFAFLDEIDSGVDVESLKKVFSGIEYLRKNGTGFMLVTHNTNILDFIVPDAVHIMKDGEIIQSGGNELIEKIKKNGF